MKESESTGEEKGRENVRMDGGQRIVTERKETLSGERVIDKEG